LSPNHFASHSETPSYRSALLVETRTTYFSSGDEGPLVHEPTGFPRIDEATHGGPVYGSRWYVLGAPDACKTAFVVQLADNFARRGIAVGLFAVDEEPSDMQTRIVQGYGFSRSDCERRDDTFLFRVQEELTQAHRVPVLYFGAEDTVESASLELAEWAARHETRAVMLYDSVQTIDCDATRLAREEPTEYMRVTRNVYAIRAAASRYKHIAIATSEMNRRSYIEGADPSGDRMGAAKQSGAIEYSARVMLAFESTKKQGKLLPDKFRVLVQKNKHGPRGSFFFLDLDRQRMRLHEGAPPEDAGEEADQASDRQARRTAASEERARKEKQAREKKAEERSREEEKRAADLDAAVIRSVQRTPGIGSADARSEVAAELGGCARDRFDASVARLRLKRALRVEIEPRSGKQRLHLPAPESDSQ